MSFNTDKIVKSVTTFNNTRLDYLKDITVIDLFLEKVNTVPNNTAVVYKSKTLSYKQLNDLSSQFANYLYHNHNIVDGDFIGLMLNKSEWLIVAILGILKTGAAYVPIDVDYPEHRKTYIKNDSHCKTIVNDALVTNFITNLSGISTNLVNIPILDSKSLIYIIYTSGTTGNPKGVMIQHQSVINLITSQTQCFNIDTSDCILQFSNYSFDASVEQIFLALCNGAKLCIVGNEVLKNHTLPNFIKENDITHLHATPSYLDTLPDLSHFKSLKRVIAGGESCSLKLAQKYGVFCDFYNEYGPTETTVTSSVYKYNSENKTLTTLPIGRPIGNTQAYILSDQLELKAIDAIGTLYLGGDGLARGYLNLPDLTAQKFITNPFDSNTKLYNTGDSAKWTEDGNLVFVGRKDTQVKIRGYRIELGEIEVALNTLPNIKQAVVIASGSDTQEKRLVAYIQLVNKSESIALVKKELSEVLPDYMLPSKFITIDAFPLTANGKIDKDNLPNPVNFRPEGAPILRRPKTTLQKSIAKVWSSVLDIAAIGVDDNFFEMGGNSLLTQKLASILTTDFGINVPITKLYQHPTIAEITAFLDANETAVASNFVHNKKKKNKDNDVAIIGMAGRFPGAATIDELWTVLKDGVETISFFTPDELDASIPAHLRNDPLYVAARGVVPSAKTFDAKFFGINPKLAQAMDPQQRLFLEIAWEALEVSGYLPKHYKGSIGVYAGSGTNSYYTNNVLPNADLVNAVGPFQVTTVNDKDYIASRVAYHLNLTGPAVSVHSACSTSLLAIAEAVEAIRNGQCDVALAGGSSITSPINSGHLYQEGSMLSSDGHCRSFDAEAKGTMFSDGAGVVLLKSLEDAIRDGDIIHGVIKGIGLNNDGSNKGSFTAPSIEGQAGAIKSALSDGNIDAATISYVETHGTATPLGDPIEMEGLNKAFGKQPINGYCAIGSVKSNMGHLTAAAGVTGVIKTILALKHKVIPASLGYKNPNPAIDFDNSPFYVNDKLSQWQSIGKRRAGISSFGVGGTNVHIVVEEFENKPTISGMSRPLQLLTWSSKSQNSQKAYTAQLGNYLNTSISQNLADVAYSLSVTRDTFNHRSFTVAETTKLAKNNLISEENTAIKHKVLKVAPNEMVFMFPGQGAQYLQMGKALYDNEIVFKEAFNTCAEILNTNLGIDIHPIIYPEQETEASLNKIKDTKFTQPCLFVIEYALSQLFISWGIKPTLLCGHSIGEFVAAHLAGVFSLKDALILVAKRGQLVSELPNGSMLSVRSSVSDLKNILPQSLAIAAINSDKLCVVSGEDEAIENFKTLLQDKGIASMPLLTSHAFHSAMMNPVLKDFEKEVKKVNRNVPRLPIVSTVTGTWLTDAEATSVAYWTTHLRATVDFSAAMDTVLDLEDSILLEVGPGRALTTLSQQKTKAKSIVTISSLTMPKANEHAYHTILDALGQLWLNGVDLNWAMFYNNQSRLKVALPAYAFDRKLCWTNPPNTIAQNIISIPPQSEFITEASQTEIVIPITTALMRKDSILQKIAEIIVNTSGIDVEPEAYNYSFLELGLDSLVLTQMAISFKNEFNIPITFRQLNDEFSSPNLLATHLDTNLPADSFAQQTPSIAVPDLSNSTTMGAVPHQNSALDLIAQQLQALGQQIQLMQGQTAQPIQSKPVQTNLVTLPTEVSDGLTEDEKKEHSKPFGAAPRIEKQSTGLNKEQKSYLEHLTETYNTKTAGSKAYSQKHRPHMADPRVVSGFKPQTKELVYPIVVGKSKGNRLWDIDGNVYLDTLNGFGSCLFGHQPDFIKEALHNQVELGFEVGPQHPLAGEVCELLCELTGHDRAALCNTGSEAVLGAMRIARTVTGRSLIVAFSRSYHGINDEVIVRGSKKLKTFPAAPGILPEAVKNMLILDYGTDESLAIIKERAHEIAAVLVEPIQSRRPEFVPVEFLKQVRNITKASQSVLIFDEIITGFRMHLGGAQQLFGIKADLATYGKVIGGGISIGVIMGNKNCMDALDGGFWQYGDASFPEVGVTYFAGTFVRHPLALATTKASLLHLKAQGEMLQDKLAAKTCRLASQLNSYFKAKKLPLEIAFYRSLWRVKMLEDVPYAELLFVSMRNKGIHIWDGFPCYLTEPYTENDIDHIIATFKLCIEELIAIGIFEHVVTDYKTPIKTSQELNIPPSKDAKLGIDASGNPAWFVKSKKDPEKFIKVELQ